MTTNCCFTHLSLGDEEILKGIVNDFSEFNKIRPMDIGEIKMDNLADELVVSYAACSRVRGFLPTYRLLTAATHSIPIV